MAPDDEVAEVSPGYKSALALGAIVERNGLAFWDAKAPVGRSGWG
jgi:hypothetical protein